MALYKSGMWVIIDSMQVNIDVPDQIHQKFKAWCTLNGLTLKDGIIKLMAEKGGNVSLKSEEK